ncbi:MAG: multiheme c-type cytochrome [Chloroflexota bacterium]
MIDSLKKSLCRSRYTLFFGLVVLVMLGVVWLGVSACTSSTTETTTENGEVNWLADSDDVCVLCHSIYTPGIVEQFGYSTMAATGNTCRDCHEVAEDYPGAEEHNGAFRLSQPTPAICESCHATEVSQFYQSRHALPAYVAMEGTGDLSPEHLAMYESIPEGGFAPDKERNALYILEGEAITRFACESCHNIGQPQADGSVGQCQDCHQRHSFSLEQVRRPETCNACHIGPDHPQWEIYQESGHGIAYATDGHNWNWDADMDVLTVSDMPAATCATCHVSAFGDNPVTHDTGDRLTWYLFASVSERRLDWQQNQALMQGICQECHSSGFITDFYTDADKAVEAVNAWVVESKAIIADLKEKGLLTAAPFDEPIDFVEFNLWHHWGRTTKFGAWMQRPDYVQWHGAYEILHDLAELKALAAEKLAEAEE